MSFICSDELVKLEEEGFGRYIDKTDMEKDKIMDARKCFSAFVKNDIRDVDPNIFRGLNENDCNAESYEKHYMTSMDIVMKKVALPVLSAWPPLTSWVHVYC